MLLGARPALWRSRLEYPSHMPTATATMAKTTAILRIATALLEMLRYQKSRPVVTSPVSWLDGYGRTICPTCKVCYDKFMDKQPSSKKRYLVIILIVLVGIIAIWGISAYAAKTSNLGSRLQFTSTSTSTGCILFFCDSPATTTYYYATSLSEDEVKDYFANNGFRFVKTSAQDSTDLELSREALVFENQGGKTLIVDYYSDPRKLQKEGVNTSQKGIVGILETYINAARSATP